jgi:hypothetical protein
LFEVYFKTSPICPRFYLTGINETKIFSNYRRFNHFSCKLLGQELSS